MPADSENFDTASDFSIQPVSSDDLPFPLSQSVEVRDKKIYNYSALKKHIFTLAKSHCIICQQQYQYLP